MSLMPKNEPDNSANKSNYHDTPNGYTCNDTLANWRSLHHRWGWGSGWGNGWDNGC